MKKILYIIPYFGKFPTLFPLWLESCRYNPTINWIIFTDDKTVYNYPDNIEVIYTTFREIRKKTQELYDFPISLEKPYKLCDYRVAYGDIFSNYIDRYASRADGVEISASQIGICAILNTIACFLFESFTWQQLVNAAIPILYAAVLSSGVAFTLQIIGQQTAEPAPAAVIMSLESVFGALGGWLVLGEIMNSTEILGCCLMLAGMLVTQAGLLLKKTRRPVG